MLDHFISSINHDNNSHAHSLINEAVVTNTIIRPFFLLVFISSSVIFGDKSTCQNERHYNDIVFDSTSNDRVFFGRKIDLLIRFGKGAKSLELSSNEFKKPTATTSQVMAQQNKNLRVNGSLLNHLRALNNKFLVC
ncbi:hypothetical protein O0I10_012617 [Lichtheimia ornata]|uniref:Uncharacterized protein n=1 Tax=Lichtheimia ornata TaxID=688661 RepID=A0AAD7URI9_9FUNG|nr:uncharacterized protein O0I10_012617 [Lichtheimia ornata]KAJ8651796.1 hypothetical protein O0I10_012617 [Lichtheimia ornata]